MAESQNATVPPEVLEWLGIEYYNEKNFQAAEKYLSALRKTDNAGKVRPYYSIHLDAATEAEKFARSGEAFVKYLQTAKDPVVRLSVY